MKFNTYLAYYLSLEASNFGFVYFLLFKKGWESSKILGNPSKQIQIELTNQLGNHICAFHGTRIKRLDKRVPD